MRLLFVTPFYKPAHVYGGPTRSISSLCENLAKIGCDVTVYTTNANGSVDLPLDTEVPHSVDGVTVRYFPRKFRGNYFYSPRLRSACRQSVGDFMLMYVASNWGYPFLPACRSAHEAGVPYVVSPRLSFNRNPWKGKYLKKMTYHCLLERRWINHAGALHYTTEMERKDSEWLRLQPPPFIVTNPVNLMEFEKLPLRGTFRRAWGIPEDGKVVLFLGRIEPRKGLDITLHSFRQAALSHPDALLVLAGPEEDAYVQSLKKLAEKLGITGRVLFPGYLDAVSRLSALADSDVFLLTSYAENFGVAVVEAMAAGLPVIVSDQVGIAEDIHRDGAGVVVPLDAAEVGRELAGLLASPEAREDLSRNAVQSAKKRYFPPMVAKDMLTEFEKVIRASSGNPG